MVGQICLPRRVRGAVSPLAYIFLRNHPVGVQLTDFVLRSFVVQMALLHQSSQKVLLALNFPKREAIIIAWPPKLESGIKTHDASLWTGWVGRVRRHR